MKNDSVSHPCEWRIIEEFPNYEITIDGKIRHIKKKKIRKISKGARGYPVVSMRKDGKSYLRTIHVLIARTFIPNPDNKTQVNHIDGDKENYSIDNLEWCTPRENVLHARRTGLQKSDGDKRVAQYTKDGEFVATYKSVSGASRKTGINRCAIGFVANRKPRYKSAGGYIWRWA